MIQIHHTVLVVLMIFSCSESTTHHDGSFFGGENASEVADQTVGGQEANPAPIDPNASGCEIKNNTLLKEGCAEYSGFARNRLSSDCDNLAGIIVKDCSLYYGKSRCIGSVGGFGGITIYGASQDECDLIKADPMIPEGTAINYIP